MDHTVNSAEMLEDLGYHFLHSLAIGNVATHDDDLSAVLFDGLQFRYPVADWIFDIVRGEPLVPLNSRRHFRASQQDQFCFHSFRQILGELERNATQSAGDQINAAVAQLRCGSVLLFQLKRLEKLHPTRVVAISNDSIRYGPGELCHELVHQSVYCCATGFRKNNVDAAAREVGIL